MDTRTVAVIGAGTMGAGIAQTMCQGGLATRLVDADAGALARGVERAEAFWQKGIAKGKVTPDQHAAWRSRLEATGDLAQAVGDAELVVEAVPEDLGLKRGVFADLDRLAPPEALLATNTSSLSVAAIASATKRPQRVLGMHFFNPVPLMRLLELVRHEDTGDAAVEEASAVGRVLGKTCIVVRDRPGFATSRLGIALGNEAARMLEEGVASAADIDTAMRLGYGHPMGPLELSDLVGLDVRHQITMYLQETLGGPQWAPPEVTRCLVEQGDLGKKTGRGFYDWSTGAPKPRPLPLGPEATA